MSLPFYEKKKKNYFCLILKQISNKISNVAIKTAK